MTSYKWYQSMGICPVCHKAKIYEGEAMCLHCSNRKWEYTHTKEAIAKNRESCKRRKEKLKAQGICLRCQKHPAMDGRTKCFKCAQKNISECKAYAKRRKERKWTDSCHSTIG